MARAWGTWRIATLGTVVLGLLGGVMAPASRALDVPDLTFLPTLPSPLSGVSPPLAGCDDLDTASCLLPFPNDKFTVADPATATGRRINFSPLAMPRNSAGKPIDPTEWNRNDGFSPGSMLLTVVPGIDLAKTGAAPITDIGRSLRRDQSIVLINSRTGERHPLWSELDANATDATRRALIVRPAVNLDEGTRYVVALRRLRRGDGSTIAAGPAFASKHRCVSGKGAVQTDPLLAELAGFGVGCKDLFLSWSFTVASEQNLTGRMLKIRDDAFASLAGKAPAFRVTKVTDYTTQQDDHIGREVKGEFSVPNYLNLPGGATGSTFNYLGSTDGLPSRNPASQDVTATFTCKVPRSAFPLDGVSPEGVRPSRVSLYGHGLLGGQGEVGAGNVRAMADESDITFCATDWIGMATEDVPVVGTILLDVSNFPKLADRVQQGMLDFLFLARLMKDSRGLAADPAFQFPGGRQLLDTSDVFYDGNSQGGIIGGALMAVSTDVTRGVLGVTGMNYSTLLDRSSDFSRYSPVLYASYPDKVDQQVVFALLQMLWDRAEADGYAHHMTDDPLPGTPRHQILMHVSFGDHQVANVTAEVEARTIGARLRRPALDDGRSPDIAPQWGILPIGHYPYNGSAIVYWDSHMTPAPPIENLPPTAGDDPHEFARSQVEARAQKSAFLRTIGAVIDTCAGLPCPSPS